MRKNMLIWVIGASIVFFGGIVAKAEVPFDMLTKSRLTKSIKMKKNEVSIDMIKLKVLCQSSLGPQCDQALAQANVGAGIAWNICTANINLCADAQTIALDMLNAAVEICRLENLLIYGQNSVKRPEIIATSGLLLNKSMANSLVKN